MPVLLAGREPDHIAGPDLLDRPAFALSPSAARRNDKSLTEGMRVPCSPRPRLEGNARALNERRMRGAGEERILPPVRTVQSVPPVSALIAYSFWSSEPA